MSQSLVKLFIVNDNEKFRVESTQNIPTSHLDVHLLYQRK